jgi:hypothetical protein
MAEDEHDDQPGSSRRAVFGLLAFLIGIGVVLFIVMKLRHAGQLEDCLASGRTNCAPIEGTTR